MSSYSTTDPLNHLARSIRRAGAWAGIVAISLAFSATPPLPADSPAGEQWEAGAAPRSEESSGASEMVPLELTVEIGQRLGPDGEPRPMRPGASIPLNVTVAGLELNDAGWSYANLVLELRTPDGEVVDSQERASFPQMIAREDAPEKSIPTLIQGVALEARPGQQGGTHVLLATLKDRATNLEVSTSLDVELISLEGVTSGPYMLVDSGGGFEHYVFFNYFYLFPDPDWGEEILEQWETPQLEITNGSGPPLVGFFAMFFHQYPDRVKRWEDYMWLMITRQSGQVLRRAIRSSEDPSTMAEQIHRGASRNDLNWGAFMATGDVKWVDPIIAELDALDEAENGAIFDGAWTAYWSLNANAEKHPIVREHLEKLRDEAEGERRELLDRVLDPSYRDKIREGHRSAYFERRDAAGW